jgi:mannose-6-phosphate isomerase-like protein (cupin superfamily)
MMKKSLSAVLLVLAGYVGGYLSATAPTAAQGSPAADKVLTALPPLAPDQPTKGIYWSSEKLKDAGTKMAARRAANKPMNLAEIRQLVPLPYTRTHTYNLMHRVPTPAGQPSLGEQHDGVTDLYIVIAGSGMTTVGGEIPEKKSSHPGEYTGIIRGGETFPLKAGDILEIPPSVPHATSTGPEGMTYMMVKINVGLYPWSIVGLVK